MSVTCQDTSVLAVNERDKNNLYPKRWEQIKWLTGGIKKQRFPGISHPKSHFCRLGGRASVYIFLTWIPDHV